MNDPTETERREAEWILYQIGGAEPNRYRFIVTRGFQDMAVTGALKPFEFIDTTATLSGELGGDVAVPAFDELCAALLGVARWKMPDGPCWCENERKKEGARKYHFKPCADARAAYNKTLGKE